MQQNHMLTPPYMICHCCLDISTLVDFSTTHTYLRSYNHFIRHRTDLEHINKMYDPGSGVEVYIRSYEEEQQYPEYEASRRSPLYTGKPRERFIEAVTDEQFEIVTVLHPEFDFKGKTHVEVAKSIDTEKEFVSYVEAPSGARRMPLENLGSRVIERVGEQWKTTSFVFAELPYGTLKLRS